MSVRRRLSALVAHNHLRQQSTLLSAPAAVRSHRRGLLLPATGADLTLVFRSVALTVQAEAEDEPLVVETFRKDYIAPDYLVPNIKLWFTLGNGEEPTTVRCELSIKRSETCRLGAELLLNGDELELQYVTVDGAALSPGQYTILPGVNATCNMSIPATSLPTADEFVVETEVVIHPHANSKNLGLYLSHGTLATMCEAEGFRRIAYHIDRPDILAVYEVYVEGDEAEYPQLL
jgi:aminopeptidase N